MATRAVGGGVAVTSACPRCGSADTAKLSAVHAHGTRDYVSDTDALGVTQGTSSTLAAQLAAPPAKRAGGGSTMLIVIGGVMTAFMLLVIWSLATGKHHPDDPPPQPVVAALGSAAFVLPFVALLAWGIWRRVRVARYNRTVWPPLYAEWSRGWTCRRCQAVWTP